MFCMCIFLQYIHVIDRLRPTLTTGRTFESNCPVGESPAGCEVGGKQYNVDESTEFTLHDELPIHTENSPTLHARFRFWPWNKAKHAITPFRIEIKHLYQMLL